MLALILCSNVSVPQFNVNVPLNFQAAVYKWLQLLLAAIPTLCTLVLLAKNQLEVSHSKKSPCFGSLNMVNKYKSFLTKKV
jgi:hypothetical protein